MLDSPQNAQNDAIVLKTLQKVYVLPENGGNGLNPDVFIGHFVFLSLLL